MKKSVFGLFLLLIVGLSPKSLAQLKSYSVDSQLVYPKIYTPNQIARFDTETSNLAEVDFDKIPLFLAGTIFDHYSTFKIAQKPNIQFTQLARTKYLVKVEDSGNGFFLVFNERYNPAWKLKAVDSQSTPHSTCDNFKEYTRFGVKECTPLAFSVLEDMKSSFKLLRSSDIPSHFLANGLVNGWYVAPSQNESKADTHNYILYYEVQTFFYIGVLLSVFAFLGCAFIVFIFVGQRILTSRRKTT